VLRSSHLVITTLLVFVGCNPMPQAAHAMPCACDWQQISGSPEGLKRAEAPGLSQSEKETKYLAFQIFTNYSPHPQVAQLLSNGLHEQLTPGNPALLNYVNDIKQRIGTVGKGNTRLAVILVPLCFEQSDAEVTHHVPHSYRIALSTSVQTKRSPT